MMDNFETASNTSDNPSEVSSNLSSLSGLTGYEEELHDLKHLLKGHSSSPHLVTRCSSTNHNQFEVFEDRIRQLNIELQNALRSNEKYKNDLYNMEQKTTLAFHNKFDKLARHNAQLEAQLAAANERIHNLLSKKNDGRPQLVFELEKQIIEGNSRSSLLENEVAHWKREAASSELLSSKLKLELEECKIDVSTKSNSVAGLKSKIVDLHLELQALMQDNAKANNCLRLVSNELDSYKKSEFWYREQLQQSRVQKTQASEEINRLHSLLASKQHSLDVQNTEIAKLTNSYEELRFKAQQESETLQKKIETLHDNKVEVVSTDQGAFRMYESTIQSLTRELATIKEAVDHQQNSFREVSAQNSHLVAQTTTLQKMLNEKEVSVSIVESDRRELNAKLEILDERLQKNEKVLVTAANQKSELEIALRGANREKCEIEEVVATIQGNFAKFAGKYNKLKEELHASRGEHNQKISEQEKIIKESLGENANLQKKLENLTKNLSKMSGESLKSNEENVALRSVVMSCQNENYYLKRILEEFQQTVKIAHLEIKQTCEMQENVPHVNSNSEVMSLQNGNSVCKSEIMSLQNGNNVCKSEIKLLHQHDSNAENEAIIVMEFKVQLEAYKQAITAAHNLNIQQILVRHASELRATEEIKAKLESELSLHKKAAANFQDELQIAKENMIAFLNDVQAKDMQIHYLNENLINLKSDVAVRDQRLSVTQETLARCNSDVCEVDQLNKSLQYENVELKNKLAKLVAHGNGYSKAHIEKQTELESWFLGVLQWISSNLYEVETCKNPLNNKFTATDNLEIRKSLGEINQLLEKLSISAYAHTQELQKMGLTNRKLKRKFFIVKNKLTQMEDRCKLLEKLSEKDEEAINKLTKALDCSHLASNEDKLEEIKNLRTLCKAKEMENKERQKRYEVNNRTLLKKVKEHMRGRNSAEKHCGYLQELYNNVFDELNTFKLKEAVKDGEIQALRSMCDNYKNVNARTKQDILKLEKEVAKIGGKCADYETLKENASVFEDKLMKYEKNIRSYASQLKEKEICLYNLQTEVQQVQLNNSTLQKENKTLKNQIEELCDALKSAKQDAANLEETSEKERATSQALRDELLQVQKDHATCTLQLTSVEQTSQQIQEKHKVLLEEITVLNSKLTRAGRELSNLQEQKTLSEEKDGHMQTLITNLRTEIEVLQSDLSSVRSDKYFLQRLCSDLKLSLHTCMNQSKVLKQHIRTLSAEPKDFAEPVVSLPSPSKYDDAYINQLLKQSSAPPVGKPLGDLENCLNSLKKEMVCLRKQVTEKSGFLI